MAEEKEKEKSVVKTTRPLVRGPLKPPRPRAPDASYTQPPHKKDIYIAQTGKKAEGRPSRRKFERCIVLIISRTAVPAGVAHYASASVH